MTSPVESPDCRLPCTQREVPTPNMIPRVLRHLRRGGEGATLQTYHLPREDQQQVVPYFK